MGGTRRMEGWIGGLGVDERFESILPSGACPLCSET